MIQTIPKSFMITVTKTILFYYIFPRKYQKPEKQTERNKENNFFK